MWEWWCKSGDQDQGWRLMKQGQTGSRDLLGVVERVGFFLDFLLYYKLFGVLNFAGEICCAVAE